jgi:molecular chaperone DnaK
MTITASSGLTKDEIDRRVKEAQEHATEDQQRRALIEARNQADALVYSVEKMLNDARDKMPVSELSRIDAAVTEVKTAAQGEDVEAIKRSTESLQQAAHALSQFLAKQSHQQQGRAGGQPRHEPDVHEGEVVDAEPVESSDR